MEAIALAEYIIEHIASETNLDPIKVRLENIKEEHPKIIKHINDLIQWAEIEKRKQEIEEFNKANRWVKRGLATVAMSFIHITGNWYAHISIYHGDGSVAVSHGGIEMGQGINTKVQSIKKTTC